MDQTEQNSESKKPKDSLFSQQQLPAWQPILTAGTVLPAFFVIGVAFLAIGAGLLHFSNQVMEIKIPYTDCLNDDGKICADEISKNGSEIDAPINCICKVEIKPDQFEQDMSGPVYMYYGLTNFYQNHRRYVKSRDESQLLGNVLGEPNNDCEPYAKIDGKTVVPCGAIANSLFNDKITLEYRKDENEEYQEVPLNNTGIAWESDKKYKFKNPPELGDSPTPEEWEDFFTKNNLVSPKGWGDVKLWNLTNGLENEDLIVWMRTAAFPNFRKLYRKVVHVGEFEEGLPKNYSYRLRIDYKYKVKQFSGTKSVYLSQTSVLGGKNPFLGVAYITVGTICLLTGIVFLFIHHKYGKLTSDMQDMGRRN